MKNIVLIGFMGTGKTTTGRLLASRLGRPFIDVDRKIELESQKTVVQIFETYGQAGFRKLEQAVIAKVARYKNTVIAVGDSGGLTVEDIRRLKKNGIIIGLTASLDVILERTGRRDTRPLLNCPNPEEVVTKLLAEREPVYRLAEFTVDTSDSSPQEIVERIISFLRQSRYLRRR